MELTVHVRVSTKADMAALDGLFARSYPALLKADYPPSVLVTALPLISRAQPGLVTSGTYYVAELDRTGIVGAGGWTARSGGHADVRQVVTDAGFVRRGIGRALFDRIFAEAKGAGVRVFDCNATRTAVPFYKALGFDVIEPVEVELRPAIFFPAVKMRRRM